MFTTAFALMLLPVGGQLPQTTLPLPQSTLPDAAARAALALAAAERERPTQFIPRAIPAPPPAAVLSFGSGWSVASSFTAGAPVWCGPAG